MALPREPRQKMINVMYLVLTAILALNVSNEVINAFKVVDKSLITSNENISASNETLYKSLEAKLNDPQSAEKAKIWEPKAMLAKQYSSEMMIYIDSLKHALKIGADLRMRWDEVKKDSSKEDYREDNLDASTRLFETKGKGIELKARLDKFKQDMLAIDPSIRAQFEKTFPVNTTPPVSQEGKQKNFTQSFFHMTPTVAALTMLSKFQNNVKNAESEIVTYCHSQIGAVKVIYDQFVPLVSQTSNYVMPGQTITVSAGVGAFNSQATPTVSINGQTVNAAQGYGQTTITASGAGPHSIPVHITYFDQNKVQKTLDTKIDYVVGQPGGAAVMLDKMNVFYIGVDNPISISSGTGWDKTKVSISGGTLAASGGPGKYNVRVTSPGKASITVNADGKPSTYEFRIKNIPPPILMVGPSEGGRVQSVVFKNQQFARAELKYFDFDYRYNIVSATVYFTGANFPTLQQATISGGSLAGIQAQLAKCIPGTSVTFDNVRVQGPGGPVMSIPGPGFILY